MSRPWSSVPSQYVPPVSAFDPGSSRLSITSSCARSYGFCGEMNGARIAARTTSSSNTIPNIAMGLVTKSRAIRPSGVSVAAPVASGSTITVSGSALIESSPLRLRQPHARIERRIQHVHDEIDDDEHRDDDEQIGDDHRTVEHVDRVDQQLAHARPGEHALRDNGERDQRAELQADDRDDRNKDVAEHMHADDAPIGKALRA